MTPEEALRCSAEAFVGSTGVEAGAYFDQSVIDYPQSRGLVLNSAADRLAPRPRAHGNGKSLDKLAVSLARGEAQG